MSTAGKVLVVLVMLSVVFWIVLAAGVDQLNRNGNEAVKKLVDQQEEAQKSLEEAKRQLVENRDQTTMTQEQADRDVAVLRSKQADVERARSQVVETLTRAQYQLATVQETIKGAETTAEHRTTERQEEEKALADARSEVQDLKSKNGQLLDELQSLRSQFKSSYDANKQMLSRKR